MKKPVQREADNPFTSCFFAWYILFTTFPEKKELDDNPYPATHGMDHAAGNLDCSCNIDGS